MSSTQLPQDLEKKLEALAEKTQLSKSYYVRQALEEYISEQEDALVASERLQDIESGKVKLVAWEQVKKNLFDDVGRSI